MNKKPKGPIIAAILVALLCINTVFWCIPLYFFALLKLFTPSKHKALMSRATTFFAQCWASVNKAVAHFSLPTQWKITGVDSLSKKNWYLVLSNHQSWLDIVALENALNQKIPFLKFFIKDQLKWVPFLGLAWLGLDFPFMKRYSKAQLKRNPQLKGKDLLATQRACQKFKYTPTTIMNFVEGTRFKPQKQLAQKSPYKHLLRPKAGGIGYVLQTMGQYFNEILDVTIIYSNQNNSLWDYLCGRINHICIHIHKIPLTQKLLGDYYNDPAYQQWFKGWLNARWASKDDLISQLKS